MSVAPFGETAPTGSLEFNLRFAGQYYDKERGTHYNINRDGYIQMNIYGKN